jgi:hypothetical protein
MAAEPTNRATSAVAPVENGSLGVLSKRYPNPGLFGFV